MKKVPVKPHTDDEGQGFLQRWSQRKRRGKVDENAVNVGAEAASDADIALTSGFDGGEEDVSIIKSGQQINEHNDTVRKAVYQAGDLQQEIPNIDSLTAESDLTSFFSEKVSEELRKKALRKIFSFGKYNICDGLDDYAEDYTKFEPLGNVLTADLKLRIERERLKQAAEHENANIQIINSKEGELVNEHALDHVDERTDDDDEYSQSATMQNESLFKPADNDNQTTAAASPGSLSSSKTKGHQFTEGVKRPKIT